MATETTPPNGATATRADDSVAVVNRLLKLPEQTRLDLANLLLDSVREGFTSLDEVEQRDREKLRQRIDDVVNGRVELHDAVESLNEIERRFLERHPQ